MTKLNCWEFMICRREAGGGEDKHEGICPAATDTSCNGINSGKNAGRICWAVAGSYCRDMIRHKFANYSFSCTACNFFKLVEQEEGEKNFRLKKEGHR